MDAVAYDVPDVRMSRLSHLSGVTAILTQLRSSDLATKVAPDPHLMQLVNEEIKRLANQARFRSLGGKLDSSDLVNEVWLKLLGGRAHSQPWASREHFFNTVAVTMQEVIVDHIRRANAKKRISDRKRAIMDPNEIPSNSTCDSVILVADALDQLQLLAPDAALVVRLKYFGGYTQQEIMQILDVPLATVRKHWTFGRTWIKTYLSNP